MRRLALGLGALGLAATLALGTAGDDAHPQAEAGAATRPAGVEATVEQLAFVSGEWEFRKGEDVLHEHWSAPRGDCLMGSFRWLKKGGAVWMYEFLTMRNEEGGVTMRFRHFDRELTCWEEKEEPISLRLVSLENNRAVFEHYGGDGDPWTMTFHRVDEEGLTITLKGSDEDKADGQAFAYRRPGND